MGFLFSWVRSQTYPWLDGLMFDISSVDSDFAVAQRSLMNFKKWD